MSIPSSEIVMTTSRVLGSTTDALEFNALFLTSSNTAPVDTLLKFNSAADVANYFGYDSAEYRGATCYFNGYENSLKKPSQLYFFRHVKKDSAAFLRGATSSNEAGLLKDLRAVNNGELTMTIGPEEYTLTGIDLGSIQSLSDCANVVQGKIQDKGFEESVDAWEKATVTYSSLSKAFIITAGETSTEIGVSFATGSLAELMGLTDGSGAIISPAALACTYTETLDQCATHTLNFVTYTTCEEITDTEAAKQLASWSNQMFAEGNQFLYFFYTTDASLDTTGKASLQSKVGYAQVGSAIVANVNAGREIAQMFIDQEYEGVAGVYGSIEYAAFFMGIAASVDWDKPNSTITFAFKKQSGLGANVTNQATAQALTDLKLNFVGEYASRNDNFVLSMHGQMYGSFSWIDSYINSIWLNDALQRALIDMFKSTGRIPYNSTGMALISASCVPPINRARTNGVIDKGVELSDLQKTQLSIEAGLDISDNLVNNGYYLQVQLPDAEARQKRESPICQFWYTYGGSVHQLNMPITSIA